MHQQADLEIHKRLTKVHLQFPGSSDSYCSYGYVSSLKVKTSNTDKHHIFFWGGGDTIFDIIRFLSYLQVSLKIFKKS